jgi:serine/threonine-protein kinase
MGAVYRAIDERLGRQVAIKVLAPDLASRQDFRRRFVRESRAAAAVDHPNIIPIYEAAGESGRQLYIAMRYVKGGDLQSYLDERGPLAPRQVASIISAIAGALDAAHAARIVHRDVKPRNILLDTRPSDDSDQPHVYLADFGITSLAATSGGLGPGAESPERSGLVFGTPDYMPPEAVDGLHVDGRADQFALACSAFALLCGSVPFLGLRGEARREAIARGPEPPVTMRRPGLPEALDEVFRTALARYPASRFASCRHFAAALTAAIGGEDTLTVLPGPLDIPLKQGFRYVHEPYRSGDEAIVSLGNDSVVADMESQIRHSRGGAILLAGFRGVGKTTAALRTIDELRARCDPSTVILPVYLSVARSTTTEELMFAI